MTLDQITKLDKELLAGRYEAAIAEEFCALAKFLGTTIETMIARSRTASRVIGEMHEIAPEYDFIISKWFVSSMITKIVLPNWI